MTSFDIFLNALSTATDLDGILGDECVEYPPSERVAYWATPQNAVVFGWTGGDGVHYAILKIAGHICDRSPVIQIDPMDFGEPYALLAPTFTEYLAIGCGVSLGEIEALLMREAAGQPSLLDFMRANFQRSRFKNVERDIGAYAALIVPATDGQ